MHRHGRHFAAQPHAVFMACAVIVAMLAAPVAAQNTDPPDNSPVAAAPPNNAASLESINPITVVTDAAEALPGFEGGVSSTLNVVILLTVLTLAPALVILCTSFTRIVIVLSLLRQAMGTQGLPPSQIIVGLSLFMTFMVMAPTFAEINRVAIVPMSNGEKDQMTAWADAKAPIRDFMFAQIEAQGNWGDVYMVLNYRGVDTSRPELLQRQDVDMLALIPAFILSELKTAFLIGFKLYLPFLIIDMVISSLLISMGMLMLPPVLISLPFKLMMFVLVDGWRLVVGNLLDGFVQTPFSTVIV